jgi:hypothetical protein
VSDDIDIRAFVVAKLKPILPKKWRWFDYSTSLDEITTTTVLLVLDSIERDPDAPRSHWRVSYTLSVIDPSQNPEQRETSLDDSIVALLLALDDVNDFRWTDAKRGTVGTQLGYDITLTVPVSKTEGNRP